MGASKSICSVAQCCVGLKEEYDLVDEIYEIDEVRLVQGLFKSVISGKLEGLNGVFAKVRYLVVLQDSGSDQVVDFVKSELGVLFNDLIHIDEVQVIKARDIAAFDQQSSDFKSVFVFVDPDKATIERDSTKGIDIFLFLTSKPEQRYVEQRGVEFFVEETCFPADIKHLTLYKKSMIFYRL